MNIIYLDLSPDYIPFIVQCTQADGTKINPTVDNLIIYEETGADASFDSTQITSSPFDPVQVNAKTGLWGSMIPKSELTSGYYYIALWEMTVDGNATAKVDVYFVCDSTDFQSDVTAALNTYDPPTRTEATSDKDEILAALPDAGQPDFNVSAE